MLYMLTTQKCNIPYMATTQPINKYRRFSPWQTNIASSKGKISDPSILFQLQEYVGHSQSLSKVPSTNQK